MKYLVCFLAVASAAYGKLLPDYASQYVCSRSDPKLSECLLANLNKAIPHLFPIGIPELDVTPKDPWDIPFMSANGNLEAVQVKMVMKNTTLYGWRGTVLKGFKVNPETLTGEFVMNVPFIRMTTEYYSTGRLFNLPLENSANFDGNFTGIDSAIRFALKEVEREGVKFFTVEKLAFKGRVETAHVKLTSIDEAQQPLASVIEVFFNQNDRLVLDTVNPLYRTYAAEFFKQWLERMFKLIPSEELLPN